MSDNLLKFSATLDREQLPAGQQTSDLSCQVNIKPDLLTGGGSDTATKASICLLFDCSGSMIGKKFQAALETAKMIVDVLHERHLLSLVAFQTESHIVFKNAVPTETEKNAIKEQINTLDTYLGGSTNMAAGIESALSVFSEGNADADIIVLLSDGEPIFVKRAQMAADAASQKGIQIFAVGIGESYNAKQLLRLVTPSNGAVFGASEVDRLNEIFCDLINRFDRIIATNVRLNFTFDESVQLKQIFKTSPERALYDSSAINSYDNNLELRVGNIENNKVYEFLLQIEVDGFDAGTIELIKARLQYDTNHAGKNMQAQEIILTVDFTQSDTLQPDTDEKIVNAMKSASMLQLCDDVVQACSRPDNDRALQAIDKLQQRCDEENHTALQQHLDNMASKLARGQRLSDKDRNDFLLASTIAPPKAELFEPEVELFEPEVELFEPEVELFEPEAELLVPKVEPLVPKVEVFDLVLVDPGPETIRLLREIRNATSMGLQEIADLMQSRNSVISVYKNKTSAEKLQQRLLKIGANVVVDVREEVEEDG